VAAAEMAVQVGLAIQVAQEVAQLVALVQVVAVLQWLAAELPLREVVQDMIAVAVVPVELPEL
jgi:hypothetical protein